MSKTALLPQNDDLVIDNLKENVGRSVFNLSHSTTFPIDVDGAILPICALETIPSDSFEISCECLLRQLSPLKVPLMTTIRLNTAWYWCDNRLAWKKWDRFIEGGRSGNEVYDIPRVANYFITKSSNPNKYGLADKSEIIGTNMFKNINYKNTLHTYFGISMNDSLSSSLPDYDTFSDKSDELPIAFPFFDYQLICRDYYTNIDRLISTAINDYRFYDFDDLNSDWCYSNLFPVDDDEIKLRDGTQLRSGFTSGDDPNEGIKGFVLDKVRYHNVRDDYFTSQKSSPQRGIAPTIETSVSATSLDWSKAFIDNSLLTQNEINTDLTIGLVRDMDDNGFIYAGQTTAYNDPDYQTRTQVHDFRTNNSSPLHYTPLLKDALDKVGVNVSLSGQVTASDLRLLSQLTVWQELNQLHEPTYRDFLNAHFSNIQVGETAIEKPQYIGGTSQIININEILQTSASTDSSKLGQQGATVHSLANNYVGKFFCNSYGWLIGVAYILVDQLYNPAMPRGFSRRTKEDYYFPEFANLSMQATLNKELFFSNDNEWNNLPLGYTGAYDELRSIPNHVAGDLLNSSYTDLKAWVLRREFSNDNKPALNTTFLSEKGNVDKTAWQVNSMPAFMLQCANYIKAVRPMPYVAIPKAL